MSSHLQRSTGTTFSGIPAAPAPDREAVDAEVSSETRIPFLAEGGVFGRCVMENVERRAGQFLMLVLATAATVLGWVTARLAA